MAIYICDERKHQITRKFYEIFYDNLLYQSSTISTSNDENVEQAIMWVFDKKYSSLPTQNYCIDQRQKIIFLPQFMMIK